MSATANPRSKSDQSELQASILPGLIKSFGSTFMFGAFLKLVNDALTFASPQILKYENFIILLFFYYYIVIHVKSPTTALNVIATVIFLFLGS